MINIANVQAFYGKLKELNNFDFSEIAAQLENHDMFAEQPTAIAANLPFVGQVELFLVAVKLPNTPVKSLDRASVAPDDGEYRYPSRVAWLARGGLPWGVPLQTGPFKGLVDISEYTGRHSNQFGHPGRVFGGGEWPLLKPVDFIEHLVQILNGMVKQFHPKELHTYPFDENDVCNVFAKDVTRVGGKSRTTTGEKALEVWAKLEEEIHVEEHGNCITTGSIESKGVRWNIPAFGRSHIKLI